MANKGMSGPYYVPTIKKHHSSGSSSTRCLRGVSAGDGTEETCLQQRLSQMAAIWLQYYQEYSQYHEWSSWLSQVRYTPFLHRWVRLRNNTTKSNFRKLAKHSMKSNSAHCATALLRSFWLPPYCEQSNQGQLTSWHLTDRRAQPTGRNEYKPGKATELSLSSKHFVSDARKGVWINIYLLYRYSFAWRWRYSLQHEHATVECFTMLYRSHNSQCKTP